MKPSFILNSFALSFLLSFTIGIVGIFLNLPHAFMIVASIGSGIAAPIIILALSSKPQ